MSKTDENLQAAFAGESQARNKYTYFAEVAKKEGYGYIAKLFTETAENEKRHAKDELRLLGGINDTVTNLKGAIAGEDYEVTDMYPTFAAEAEAEGNKEAARLFKSIAKVEEAHRDRYIKLLEMVENGTVYERETEIKWRCSVCGLVHVGKKAPGKCSCCKHDQAYFEPEDMWGL